jgi:hypothetical protein
MQDLPLVDPSIDSVFMISFEKWMSINPDLWIETNSFKS